MTTEHTGRDTGRGPGGIIARAARLMADNHQAVWDDPAARKYFLSDAKVLAEAGLLRGVPEPNCQLTASSDQTGSSADDVVEAVARAICNVGRDTDLWSSDELGQSTREDILAEARAAIAAMPQDGVTIEQVEQAALFMFAVRTYSHKRPDYARKCWALAIDEGDREAWRRTARDLLAFTGIPVQDGEQP